MGLRSNLSPEPESTRAVHWSRPSTQAKAMGLRSNLSPEPEPTRAVQSWKAEANAMSISRRDLLKRGAVGVAAALAAPTLLNLGCDSADKAEGDLSVDTPAADVPPEVVETHAATVYAILGSSLTELHDMGMRAAEALGFTGTALAGKTVFLKPNFVALGMEMFGVGFNANTGEVTKPEIVLGVAEQCLKAGAAKVIIGEGSQCESWEWDTVTFVDGNSIGGVTNLKAAVEALLATYGAGRVEMLCLNAVNEWHVIPSASTSELVKDGISIGKAFALADHIVSIPVIKTHQWARLSASMKNYFGAASINLHGNGVSRCQLHVAYDKMAVHGIDDAGVSGSFIDMVKWRKERGYKDYAIVDGTICLEGSGPHMAPVNDGRTIHTKARNAAGKYFLLAGNDAVAVDTTVAAIVNIAATDIKALVMARFLGLGEMDDIGVVGSSVADLQITDWMKPEMQTEDYFKGFC
jgi:uncharacterized protein (DUF362 family)